MRQNGFPLRPLGELVVNLDGRRVPVKESERRAGPYPYYGASGIVDYVDDFLFEGEHLLIAEDGENLRTRKTPVAFLANGKFWVNNHAHIVRGNDDAETRFLMYALQAADIRAYLTGSTMPKLTQSNLNRIPVPAPKPEVQCTISSVLGSLDDKISLNRRTNETLEAKAASIFDSMFSSEETGPVGEVITASRDLIDPQEDPDEQYDHHSIPAFDVGRAPSVEVGSEIKSAKFVVFGDSVLVSRLNPAVPRVWLPAPSAARRPICSTEFLVARPKGGLEEREFIFGLFRSRQFLEGIKGRATGTSNSHQRVRPDDLLEIICTIGAPERRREYSRLVRPLLERVRVNVSEISMLTATRDSLLPRLVSGEIRVK